MSIYSNVTEQDLINVRILSEQQKDQRALKIKNRTLKQTHDIKLAVNLSPVTKKLDISTKTSEKLGNVKKESNLENNNLKCLPNISNFSISMRRMLGSLMTIRNSLKITQYEFGRANILGIPIQISGGDRT